jgi:hypothetical protein
VGDLAVFLAEPSFGCLSPSLIDRAPEFWHIRTIPPRLSLDPLHLQARYLRKTPLIARRNGVVLGDRRGTDHQGRAHLPQLLAWRGQPTARRVRALP